MLFRSVISVVVTSNESTVKRYCRMKLGDGRKATIVYGWTRVVEEFKMEEGEIWIFSLKDERSLPKTQRDPWSWLRLVITKLDQQG